MSGFLAIPVVAERSARGGLEPFSRLPTENRRIVPGNAITRLLSMQTGFRRAGTGYDARACRRQRAGAGIWGSANFMNADMFDMSGRTVFVTGAASGLGFAMAEAMAERGAAVALADSDGERLDTALEHFRAITNRAEAIALDVRDTTAIRREVEAFASRRGRLDAMFANAGITGGAPISQPDGFIENVDLAVWRNVIDVNLTGAFATMQAAAAVMKPQNSGSIVVTASIAGLQTSAISGYAYSATKAGVAYLTRLAAAELAAHNIRVNAIAPGPFLTNIADGRMFREPERVEFMASTTALGRVADPSELKGLALLLASGASGFITGQVIPIDGGSMVRPG